MIKAVIFDFGDVLTIPGNTLKILRKYKQHLKISPEEALEKVYGSNHLPELMRGNITLNEFNKFVRNVQGIDEKVNEKISREMRDNLQLNPDVISIVKQLQKYKLAILSDHIKGIFEHQVERLELTKYFDLIIFSAEHGVLKADGELFDILLTRLKLEPRECVFIDDLEKNIKVADKKGFATIHFKDAKQLKQELAQILGDELQ